MTDLAPLKLLAAGGSGGEETYQYPEEVYNAELYAGGQWYEPEGVGVGVVAYGTITTSNTNPYDTNYDRDGFYSSIFNGTGQLQLVQSTEHMNDVTGGSFFVSFWMKTDVYSQESSEDRTIFVQDTGIGANYANKIKIGITSAQKIAVFKTIDLGGTPIITSTTSVCDDAWHFVHVCRAKDETTVRLFIDGNADGTATESTSFGTVNVNAYGPKPAIGSARNQTGRYSGSLHQVMWSFSQKGTENSADIKTSNYTVSTSWPQNMYYLGYYMACSSSGNQKVKAWSNRKVLGPRIKAYPNMLTWVKRQNTESTGNADQWPVMSANILNIYGYDILYPANAVDKATDTYSFRTYNTYTDTSTTTTKRDYIVGKGHIVGSYETKTGEDKFSYIARTLKPAKGFCDILTYEGTGSSQTINHNLGCNIGFMLIKDVDADVGWVAKHVNHSGADYYQRFDEHANQISDSTLFNSTANTSTQFTVGTSALTNTSGHTYVAILLAAGDDAASSVWGPSSNEKMIKCGYYNGNGSTTGPIVDVGFEPTTLLIKGYSITGNSGTSYWMLFDETRKFEARQEGRVWIEYNEWWDKVESVGVQQSRTGFQLRSDTTNFNENNGVYLYVAIRGPMRTPSAANGDKPSHFFNASYSKADTSDVKGTFPGAENAPNFQADFAMHRQPATSSYQYVQARKSGYYYRATNHSSALDSSGVWSQFAVEPGFGTDWATTYFAWMWKQAPGLMRCEYYVGNGSNRNVTHDLGVTPEMIMIWRLGPQGTPEYTIYGHKGLNAGTNPWQYWQYAQFGLADYSYGNVGWNNTAPTSSVFSLGTSSNTNKSGDEYVAVLFASLAGFQKVGFYQGNGSAGHTIDCGFTTGSRYVMIKNTSAAGNWKQYDTTRGLSSSVSMNCNANDYTAQTDDDFLRQHNSGFQLNGSDNEVNGNGYNYIYLAVANDPT